MSWSSILTGTLPVIQAPERTPKFVPRPRTTATARVLKYKQYKDSEARERRVWIEFPAGENCGEATFETFDVAKWRAEQDKVAEGSIHPRSAAVTESMRDPPPGERLHPDRNTMPTASGLASILAPQDYNYDEVHLAGYDSVMDHQVAVATGKAPKKPQTHHMIRGNKEEAEVLDLFELITGLELYRDKAMGLVVHPSGKPGATPDGICVRVPMLIEAKSTDKRLTVEKIPLPHYYQTQTQMYVTMDTTTGLPRIRYVGYIQYCSHPELKRVPHSKAPAMRSSEPRVRILLVKFNAEAAARIAEASSRYMDRLSAARTEQQSSSPATPAPTPREPVQKRPKREEAARLAQRLAKTVRERDVINSQLQQIDAVHTNATMIEGSVMVQRATVTAAKRVEDLNRHMVTKAEATRSAAKVAQVVQRLDVSNDAVDELTEAISSAAGEVLESAAAGGDGDSPEQKEIDAILAQWDDAQQLEASGT